MRKYIALLLLLNASICFADDTDRSAEYIFNRIFDSSTNSLKVSSSGGLSEVSSDTTPQLGGNLDLNDKDILDQTYNKYSSDVSTVTVSYPKLTRPVLSGPNRLRLNEFTVKQSNTGVTGGVGISGATYVPEVDLLFMVDNNALNVSIYHAGDVDGTEFGNITFSGFTDPECLEYLWTIYDSNGKPDTAVFAVGEEQNNTIILFEWDLQATSGTITKGDWPVIDPTNMFSEDATQGMEGMTYIPDINSLFVCKQSADECRIIPLDGTLTPAATEPFDAATVWTGAGIPNLNDLTYDRNTGLVIAIGDQISTSNTNIDIWSFDPFTGAIVEYLDNFPNSVGLTPAAGFGQCEGIAISPDGQSLWITSEGNEAAWLTRGGGSPWTQGTGVMTQTTANTVPEVRVSTDGTIYSLALIQDLGASDIDGNEINCFRFERYDNNELESSQSVPHRGQFCSETPVGATGVEQESGAQLVFQTTLGSGTHGVNTNVTNARMFNTGRTKIGSDNSDLAARFQIDGTADEIQMILQAHSSQTNPLVTVESSGGTDLLLIDESGAMVPQNTSLSIADSGDGNPAAGTLTPTTSYTEVTCNDANGCTLEISETGARAGQMIFIVNVGTNSTTLNDTAGQTLTTNPALGQGDTATLLYSSTLSAWVQYATSNN